MIAIGLRPETPYLIFYPFAGQYLIFYEQGGLAGRRWLIVGLEPDG